MAEDSMTKTPMTSTELLIVVCIWIIEGLCVLLVPKIEYHRDVKRYGKDLADWLWNSPNKKWHPGDI